LPFLSNLELREIVINPEKLKTARTDANLKANSSASDFVRLIWSYLLALYQASTLSGGGNMHPGMILFDEPGQHSMAESSQRALLLQLSGSKKLQSLVAASFDESDAVFKEVTQGINFKLHEITGKSIKPFN